MTVGRKPSTSHADNKREKRQQQNYRKSAIVMVAISFTKNFSNARLNYISVEILDNRKKFQERTFAADEE